MLWKECRSDGLQGISAARVHVVLRTSMISSAVTSTLTKVCFRVRPYVSVKYPANH